MKSAAEVATAARESINKLQKKTFSAVLTRRTAKEKSTSADEKERRMDVSSGRMFDGLIASKLLNVEKFSSLSRLVRVTAWSSQRMAEDWN